MYIKGGVGVVDEYLDSERMYYSQLFYRSYLNNPQRHEIHIVFVWNTELHLNVMQSFYVHYSHAYYQWSLYTCSI